MHVRVRPHDATDEVAQDARVDLGQAAINSGNSGKSSMALAHDYKRGGNGVLSRPHGLRVGISRGTTALGGESGHVPRTSVGANTHRS